MAHIQKWKIGHIEHPRLFLFTNFGAFEWPNDPTTADCS